MRSGYPKKHRASRRLAGHVAPDAGVAESGPVRRGRARTARFLMVGAVGVGVNNGVLLLLHGLAALPLVIASAIAAELAIAHNYVLNEVWTFRPGRLSARRFGAFNLTGLGALAVNVGVLQLLTLAGTWYLLANVAGVAAAAGVNLALSTSWIWSDRTHADAGTGPDRGALPAAFGAGRPRSLSDDLLMGPAGRTGARARPRAVGRAAVVLHRDRAGAPRRRGHPGDHRPGRPE
ncbi:MAG TPA: GtrA family protein [Rugosimonospora sp.]|nr:GtrA family protein [Rugosimonospora sp.]